MRVKRFESINDFPKVGDYVLLNANTSFWTPRYIEFVNSHIGKVTEVDFNYKKCKIKIYGQWGQFDNDDSSWFEIHEIKYWSESKEELELILQANKYNL